MLTFTAITGLAAPMPAANVDTDVIMPKQFLKGTDRTGLAVGVFHHLRFDANGIERPDFILNKRDWRAASFLIVGRNFGCGSSREHAVWGLMQLGIRGLIGTSFAGIFFDNCARNGLLAIELEETDHLQLMQSAADPSSNRLTIDLPAQLIHAGTRVCIRFPIDPTLRDALIQGLDSVGATLEQRDAIIAFERDHFAQNPWLA